MTTAQTVEVHLANSLISDTGLAFIGRDIKGQPILQHVTPEPPEEGCWHLDDPLATTSCHFCLKKLEPTHEVYYHCCECHAGNAQASQNNIDICARCLTTMGSGCKARNQHALRKLGSCKVAVLETQSKEEGQLVAYIEDEAPPLPKRTVQSKVPGSWT